MSNQPKLIVSPVGISLLLNYASQIRQDSDLRKQFLLHSNDKNLPQELAGQVEELFGEILTCLIDANVETRRKLSAELNGLYGLFPNGQFSKSDMHLLIATDTELGQTTARILDEFLREHGVRNIQIICPPGLQTEDEVQFRRAIRELFADLESILPEYKNKVYQITFNLTGGFKSLYSYLSIVGMFYGDKIVYIFENGKLLSIPRLPLKIDDSQLRQPEQAVQLALLAAGHIYRRSDIQLPGALWEEDEKGDVTISEWGQLIWDQVKNDILSKGLLLFPYLEYESTFRKDFEKATPEQRIRLQETLAKASKLLLEHQGNIKALKEHGGLQYDNYTNKSLPDGTPIGHFRINEGDRVTCIAVGGKLYLRHFGSHDYTESKEGVR